MGSSKRIGTHNGSFHCDEVVACFLLKQLPEYANAEIVRTRDPATLDTCDIVVDVGAVYDEGKKRFDHHQKTFQETMKSLRSDLPWEIRLSSAGLVYFHYGQRIIADRLKRPIDDPETDIIFRKIYEGFIMEIDAIDNGVDASDGVLRYKISTGLSSRVGCLNPLWNEDQSAAVTNQKFEEAMQMAGKEFLDRIDYYRDAWLPAKEIVSRALEKRKEVHESGEIIELEQAGCPWKDHLFSLEENLNIQGEIKFVIYKDSSNDSYRVQCVPRTLQSFENRLSLLWKGLRDDDLSRESGIPGCIFVHASGFIGGNKTRDGALEMAKLTLKTQLIH